MAQQIVEFQPQLLGLLSPSEFGLLLDTFQVESQGRDIAINRLPSKDERTALQTRNASLVATLRPLSMSTTEKDRGAQAVRALLVGFFNVPKSEVDGRTAALMLHLETLPLFALVKACEDFSQNRVADYDPKYPPNSPQIIAVARRYVERAAIEQMRIDKVLRARIVFRPAEAPGARERIMASLQDFHGRVPQTGSLIDEDEKKAINRRMQEEHHNAILREYDALGIDPIYSAGKVVSPALARKMGALR